DVGLVALLMGVPAFGVHQPVGGKAFEERVQVLVVGADAAGTEPHAQEQAVDPVDLMVGDEPADQLAVDGELIPAGLPAVEADLAGRKVDDDRLLAGDPQQYRAAYPGPDMAGQ